MSSVPLDILEAARFRSRVHVGPGVVVPDVLSMHLSSRLRFMLYTSPRPDTVRDAYKDFCDRLRWQYQFAKEKHSNPLFEEREFDPDYKVPHERVEADYQDQYFELGLSKGQAYIDDYCRTVIPKIKAMPHKTEMAWFTELEVFLKAKNYIVSLTDKNLGVAVITREWFNESSKVLLCDQTNYQPINPDERNFILETQHTIAKELSSFAKDVIKNDQLAVFLRSKCPASDDANDAKVPVFYGIPKIHKQPTKMCPIMPCHSCIQAPAAKYVSKQLKELLKDRPYVLKGTKDLAQKLSKLKIPKGRKAYIVTGDVVAFYPNVPADRCMEVVSIWWAETIGIHKRASECQLFGRRMQLASNDLIMEFDGVTYKQLRGLAMGMAHSPDMANLYGAFYEEHAFSNLETLKRHVPFYGRFIDDLISIVYADSASEALATMQLLSFPGLELTWEVSEWNSPFLDMLVYIDPVTGQVEHTPYRKALNHKEHIPWVSHHPKDVKRGTYIGEMSRLVAMLSSKVEHYQEVITELYYLYVARGYPPDLVLKWTKEYISKQWASRLDKPMRAPESVFVLKSHFSPSWEYFNVQELGQLIKDSWVSSLQDLYENQHRRDKGEDVIELEPTPRAPRHSSPPVQRSLDDFWSTRSVPLAESSASLPHVQEGRNSPPSTGSVQEASEPDPEIPPYGRQLVGTSALVETGAIRCLSVSNSYEIMKALDVVFEGFLDRRWLVSRKRNRNVADLMSVWKKAVLESVSESEEFRFADLVEWN